MHLQHPFVLYTLIGGVVVAASYPMWRPVDTKDLPGPHQVEWQEPEPPAEVDKRVFRRAPKETGRVLIGPEGQAYARKDLHAKFRRLAQLERRNVREQLENSGGMDPATLTRLTEELEELDRLVQLFPEVAEEVLAPKPNPLVQEDGTYTDEFSQTVRVLQSSGEWYRMKDRHEQRLLQTAHDPEISPQERPSEEEVLEARKQNTLPAF